MLPPVAVIEVPVDGSRNARIKGILRLPAQLRLNLGRIHGVAQIVARAVLYELDQALRLVKRPENGLYHLQIGPLVVSADVVDLSHAALSDHQVDGRAMVGDIEPVADIFPCTVNRQLLIRQRAADDERNQLLREMVGSVVVGAAGNGHRQAVGPVVGQHKEIRRRLRAGIGARGMNRGLLREEQVRTVQGKIPVDLVGGYLVIALDAVGPAGIQERGGSHHIGPHKGLRIGDGAVHMALRRKVHDNIRLLFLKQIKDKLPVCDVAPDKLIIRLSLQRRHRLQVARVGQKIQIDELILRIFIHHIVHEVAADKSGAAGYDKFHNIFPSAYALVLLILPDICGAAWSGPRTCRPERPSDTFRTGSSCRPHRRPEPLPPRSSR